jgi:uncharacterized membrane protein
MFRNRHVASKIAFGFFCLSLIFLLLIVNGLIVPKEFQHSAITYLIVNGSIAAVLSFVFYGIENDKG